MQAIKFTIPGLYWDSQIYAGFLYLFGRNGEIIVLNWNKVISELPIQDDLKVARDTAFRQSNFLYSRCVRPLMIDPEIKAVLIKKFERLAELDLSIQVAKNKPVIQDNPLPFPHTDSDIHYRTLFVGAQSGLFASKCKGTSKKPIDDSERHWDVPVFDLSAAHRTVALAAGAEGLYEYELDDYSSEYNQINPAPSRVAPQHCTMCEWAFYSIYGSSHLESGFLASFEKVKADESPRKSERPIRRLEGLFSSAKLFHHPNNHGFSWGAQDKLYYYKNGVIDILRYNPRRKWEQGRFEALPSITLQPWKGDVVSARVASFGMVIECDNALVVIRSDGKISTFEGEPINWRVFPKSENYTNQLHVIYADRLEIISFFHDYFTDQQSKVSGINMGLSDEL